MPKPSSDWDCDILRKAAVEYALQQCGEIPKGIVRRADYQSLVADCAKSLGVPSAADLFKWMQTVAYLPEYRERAGFKQTIQGGEGLQGVDFDDDDDYQTALATAAPVEMPEGAMPAAQSDPLAALLSTESASLHEADRLALADALEHGVQLSAAQRTALAVLLRGASLANHLDVVRAVIDWIVPRKTAVENVWEMRESRVTAPLGSTYRYDPVPLPVKRSKRCAMGSSRLSIIAPDGVPVHVRFYCRVKGVIPNARSCEFRLRYLVPVEKFARDHVLHQFAILSSFVRADGRTGKQWGELFGNTKQNMSHHRKSLNKKLNQSSGSNLTFRGLRHKADPRKGTKITKPESAA